MFVDEGELRQSRARLRCPQSGPEHSLPAMLETRRAGWQSETKTSSTQKWAEASSGQASLMQLMVIENVASWRCESLRGCLSKDLCLPGIVLKTPTFCRSQEDSVVPLPGGRSVMKYACCQVVGLVPELIYIYIYMYIYIYLHLHLHIHIHIHISVEQAELPTDTNYTHKEALCRGHTSKNKPTYRL